MCMDPTSDLPAGNHSEAQHLSGSCPIQRHDPDTYLYIGLAVDHPPLPVITCAVPSGCATMVLLELLGSSTVPRHPHPAEWGRGGCSSSRMQWRMLLSK